jgi:CDP-glucose 4,6-dehydratase
MHFLVTGHTGFKGSWLVSRLLDLGHNVSGLALDPLAGAHFVTAEVTERMTTDARVDIRDSDKTIETIAREEPDVVIHMAAQPLVRASYLDPRTTIETNVNGTFNVLQTITKTESVKAAVIVTTDKVYQNVGKAQGYVEDDPLGGHDPYSASKAMADILTTSWASSFDGCSIGIARAGNVIGGGDVSEDRLFPDLVRSFASGEPAGLRAPASVRPWQHVLDCLQGYLALVDHLLDTHSAGDAWNFGPDPGSFRTVAQAATVAAESWGAGASWEVVADNGPHEASMLTLDSTKARDQLGWSDRLSFEEAIEWTIRWSKEVEAGRDPWEVTQEQIAAFADRAGSL